MDIKVLKNELQELINKTVPDRIGIVLKYQNKELYEQVLERTLFLKEDVKITERIWCILNDVMKEEDKPSCELCWNRDWLKFQKFEEGYSKYCSSECRKKWVSISCKKAQSNKTYEEKQEMVKKIKETVKSKYWVENVSELDWVKEKREDSIFNKFWAKNYNQS